MSDFARPRTEPTPLGGRPQKLRVRLKAGTWLYVILWILDIGQIIVAAIAYTLTETDNEPELALVFPELGHHIQRLEIAMPSLGWLVDSFLLVLHSEDESEYANARQLVYRIFIPWHAFAAAVWAVAAGLQTTYVIGPNKLEVCVDYPNFTPCKCVMASWVMAIILL